jgi:Asp-tRNA(Asn)/Glu-tRNA(Gln) amidotransferase A subunit family amidase
MNNDASASQAKRAPESSIVSNGRAIRRRAALRILAASGIGTVAFQRALAARVAESGQVTAEMIEQAEWIAGLELDAETRKETARALERARKDVEALRKISLDNGVAPAVHFQVASPARPDSPGTTMVSPANPSEWASVQRPDQKELLAHLPVTELASLIRSRQISSEELTRLYLDRLHQYDGMLHCVVTFTDDLAIRQARLADRELAAGRYRGPLHGIPWGAKDLIAYPPFPTTWGAPQFKEQVVAPKATVAERLDQSGAVLLAKLSLGALAMGDEWFGGKTRNPWDPTQGSSGSSAGSAAATAAGLVGFAIGSETLGSIVSPCRRCGTSGLRPTFGRVSRAGCMTLAWTMDKIGPIARSVEDCALVFSVIHGSDARDPTSVDRPFRWPLRRGLTTLRVGYVESSRGDPQRPELEVLRALGVQLVPFELPDDPPARPISAMLNVEAATVFDELLRSGDLEGLNRWPAAWRKAQFVTGVEYLRASRCRSLLMQNMEKVFREIDLYVGGNDLVITNLTGHPTVVLPNGFRKLGEREVPSSITFTGKLFGESELLAVAHAYQQVTGHHLRRPELTKPDEE